MSKISVPKRSSSRLAKASTSSSKGSKLCPAKAVPLPPEPTPVGRQTKEFTLPAFSIPYVAPKTVSEMDKLRKKTIRRNAPPGEDLKEIKNIIKNIKGQDVSVQEFLGLVGPSTGDRGLALKEVMNDDLASFRKLARKVYEMITKDSSDVLLNQQMDIADFYRDRKEQLRHQMLIAIEKIYDMYPNFNFERYCKQRDKYLDEIFPVPDELKVEPEELELLKRQQAYHRLQWLRSEGERLNQENNALKKRLSEMKRLHRDEQDKAQHMAVEAMTKRAALEAAEADKQDTLDMLNESLEKTIISKEKGLRKATDKSALAPKKKGSSLAQKKKMAKSAPRPAWMDVTSAEIDEINNRDRAIADTLQIQGGMRYSPNARQPCSPPPQQQSPPVKQPAINQVMRRRRVHQTPADSWGGCG